MSELEYIDFRAKFKNIIYLKSWVKKMNDNIQNLTRLDKNGSHNNAILKAINFRNIAKAEYTKCLNGFEYEKWLKKSKELTKLQRKITHRKKNRDSILREYNEFSLDLSN